MSGKYDEDYDDIECCSKCRFFEDRTHFCRFDPPIPIIFYDGNIQNVSSKFPVITKPDIDYCGKFKYRDMNSKVIL